jgi:hypothetical protein
MKEKRPRGFAAFDAAHRREIARKGGQRAHAQGTAHEFTSAEAHAARRKGGGGSKPQPCLYGEDRAEGGPAAPSPPAGLPVSRCLSLHLIIGL